MQPGKLLTKRLQIIFSQISEISVDSLLKKMAEKTHFYLIDVREEAEWQHGSIPNAIYITRGKLELTIEKVTEDVEADIVLYCGGGTRSALAAENLQAMGYKNVKSLTGGFRKWYEQQPSIFEY